jgi:hypothetical protein
MYKGAEAQTIGAPIVGKDAGAIMSNRRNVRGKMNELGDRAKTLVQQLVNNRVGKVPVLSFSKLAGCGMCPCSPGYKIFLDVTDEQGEQIRADFKYAGRIAFGYWSDRTSQFYKVLGARDAGLSIWGEVVKGKVELRTPKDDTQNAKVFEVVKEILK